MGSADPAILPPGAIPIIQRLDAEGSEKAEATALCESPARLALKAACKPARGGGTLQSPREEGTTVGYATLRVANPTLETADRG
jgi:hypothetical protein